MVPASSSTVEAQPAKNNLLSRARKAVLKAYGKSLTWRVIASADTFAITTAVTHNPLHAAAVVASESVSKMLWVYPGHELVWRNIPFGKKPDGTSTHARSFIKGVTYRMVGSADTFLMTSLVTGKLGKAAVVAGVEFFTKTGLYYFHERGWQAIDKRRQHAANATKQRRIERIERHMTKSRSRNAGQPVT